MRKVIKVATGLLTSAFARLSCPSFDVWLGPGERASVVSTGDGCAKAAYTCRRKKLCTGMFHSYISQD